ncbi:LysR substrate-binding domain-containing protein [Bartonella sp. LJL80]
MNPRRLTPSMSLLLAFEAAARHESYTRAAEELALTQSAVSRQVQTLEKMIDVALFVKNGRKIALTDAGRLYKQELEPALAAIRNATLQTIAFASGEGTLRLTVLPTFGTKWLLPKLNDFYKTFPNISLHIHSSIAPVDFRKSQTDAAISVGSGQWDGGFCDHLMDEELVVIGRPEDFPTNRHCKAEDIANLVLLNIINNADSWGRWFDHFGLPRRMMRQGAHFELTSHLIQAVKAGVGIGLVPKVLVEDELAAGELYSPLPAVKSTRQYFLVYPERSAALPSLIKFRQWLSTQ